MRSVASCHSTASGVSPPLLKAQARCRSATRPSMPQESTSGPTGKQTASTARTVNRGRSATSSGTSIRPATRWQAHFAADLRRAVTEVGLRRFPPRPVRRAEACAARRRDRGRPRGCVPCIDRPPGRRTARRATDLQQRQRLPDLVDRRRESGRGLHRGVVASRPAHRPRAGSRRRRTALAPERSVILAAYLSVYAQGGDEAAACAAQCLQLATAFSHGATVLAPRRGARRSHRGVLRPPPRAERRERGRDAPLLRLRCPLRRPALRPARGGCHDDARRRRQRGGQSHAPVPISHESRAGSLWVRPFASRPVCSSA